MSRSRIPAPVVARFPQSIARCSQSLRAMIGPARLAIADELELARLGETAEDCRRAALLAAMLKEAA